VRRKDLTPYTEPFQPKHLKLWQHPPYYIGKTWYEYYPVIGQHRDSKRLDRSNFAVAQEILQDVAKAYPEWKNESPMLVNPYESHWAVGHTEWIGVHKDAPVEVLKTAEWLLGKLEDYPILDETRYSDLEWKETSEYWESCSLSTRLEYLKEDSIPCFAARHDLSTIMHEYESDMLWESLTAE
jgi:hypothetical protein